MPTTGRCRRLAAALLVVCAFSTSTAFAQSPTEPLLRPSLRIPTIAAGVAAAADWATTYHALTNYRVHETNPFLRPWYDSPGKLVGMGALMDIGAVSAWNITMGQKHPRVAIAGLWAMTAFRSYLAFHNLRNEQRAARR
jgi:hypothetical protein